jgi:hypothetical protein
MSSFNMDRSCKGRAGRKMPGGFFMEMADEAPHLSSRERRFNQTWISKAKKELKKWRAKTPAS